MAKVENPKSPAGILVVSHLGVVEVEAQAQAGAIGTNSQALKVQGGMPTMDPLKSQ